MKKFNKVSKSYINKPWIETDFALEILPKKKANEKMKQVVHYHFKNLEKIYNPCYSNRIYGIYADRNLNKIKIPS